jgi:UTP--glucose-1-phosphate uridylyltransferase
MKKRVTKAVIPAAGLGTRFLPATKAIPKEMLPIVDVPTIQLVVEEALEAGITMVVLIQGRYKGAVEDHFDMSYELEDTLRRRNKHDHLEMLARISKMVRLVSVRQKEPLGLGHAVLCAREIIGDDEPFAVLLGDDLFDTAGLGRSGIGQLIDVYEREQRATIAVQEVPVGQEHLYGIVSGEPHGPRTIRVREMVEKPKPGTAKSRNAIIGRYVLPGEIFQVLAETQAGAGGEIQLTDALHTLAKREPGLLGHTLEGERHDAGDRFGYLRANIMYALKRPELADKLRELMRELGKA